MSKKSKKKPKELPNELEPITGTLRTHPKGFGFVIPDHPNKCPQDIFIPKHLTDNAVDGDHVEIQLQPRVNWEKGPEGRVIAVLKRGRTHLAGTIRSISPQGEIAAYVPLLGTTRQVIVQAEENGKPLKVGDRVIMKVISWGDQQAATLCVVSHYIGHINNPSCDVAAAVEEFDLHQNFSKEALKEAKSFGDEVQQKDLKGRKDLTKINCFTIDPETAKDFDDAVSLSKDHQGHYYLGVHIADVAHYVSAHSTLDKEAFERANSTYFPGTVVPMLPPILSDNLCSLKQGVIRLTVSVFMTFDSTGNLLKSEVVRSFIKSKKRFSYPEAKEVLDGKKKNVHKQTLEKMVELCQVLKQKRFERGSLDFALPELFIVVDKNGVPTGVKIIEYDITHQLIEEFMLKANEVVAFYLEKLGKSLIFRIHEEPSSENIEEFYALARSLGFALPKKPKHADLQKLFNRAKESSHAQQLSVAFIRSMKLANYSPHNVGHYGLALEHYCHFTSPIRRYSDLIIQRLLFHEEDEKMDLSEIAQKCSEQERISFRAEMSVRILKKLRLLNRYFHEDPTRKYLAIVTRIKPFGLYFEMKELALEGFLHISELEDDYFIYDAKQPLLFGKATGKKHYIGEEILVKIHAIDFILLECKWELVGKRMPRKFKKKSRR